MARAAIHVFFRRTEVDHGDRLPARGPVLVVANHTNGLVDGLLLIACLRRYPRFLGKATLFRIPVLGWLLRAAGVVPIQRPKDGGGTAGNEETFRSCRARLAGGGVVALFPEGISHDEASLQPLRTGAARIAIGAAAEGASGLVIVPVGLAYDDKARFRSRALVTVGAPLPVAASDDVRELTARIDRALRAAGPDFESPAEAAELASIAEVVAAEHDLGTRESIARELARSGQLDDLRAAHATYRRDLALLGLSDRQLTADVSPGRLRAFVVWSLVRFVVSAPIAAAGYAVHVVPYEIIRRVARRPRNEGVKSTVKVLGCAVLFLTMWVTLAIVAGARWGWLPGIGVLVACPLAGFTTVRFTERLLAVGGLLRGWRVLRAKGSTIDSVRANRARVVDLAARATA